MQFTHELLNAICDVELHFKIQLDRVEYKSKALELTMGGNWVYNYNSGGNHDQPYTITDAIDALCNEFIDGQKYVFWWYVRHMLKVLCLGNIAKIYLRFDSKDIDVLIDAGGIYYIRDTSTIRVLRVVAMRKSNFDALEHLYYGALDYREYEVVYLAMQYGTVDALKWCESKGLPLTIGSPTCLRYVARLDVAKYLYEHNPGWFVGARFSITDALYYCNSTINREEELIEWLISKMRIDVVDDLELNVEYVVSRICDCRDLAMMCWLIDNYKDDLLDEGKYTNHRILISAMNMLLPGSIHIINPPEYSEPYLDNAIITKPFCMLAKLIKGPVALGLNSARYVDPKNYAFALEFLAKQHTVVGFTKEHAQILATYNKFDALKHLCNMHPELIGTWVVKSSIDCNDKDYSFMQTISAEDLRGLIKRYARDFRVSVLRNMRNANKSLFDACADYKYILDVVICARQRDNMLVWIAYDCGYKLPVMKRLYPHDVYSDSFIYFKILADQNNRPFSEIYDML